MGVSPNTVLEPASAEITILGLRQFVSDELGFRFAAEPGLVESFWNQITEREEQANLTVLCFSISRLGRKYLLVEFVAGETLEDLVKRSDPATCESEIPLFSRILDAVEDLGNSAGPRPIADGLKLVEFGAGHTQVANASKLRGAILVGPDGRRTDEVVGDLTEDKQEFFDAVLGLCAMLPSAHGANNARANTVPSPKAVPATEAAIARAHKTLPYLIAIATAALVMLTFHGVGAFLASRTVPQNAGKLFVPPLPVIVEKPIEIAPASDELQLAAEPPPAPPVAKPAQARKTRPEPTPSIVLARGARPIRQTSLAYPAEAQKEHVSGVVEMQVTIAEDGSVQSPRVLSGDPLLRAGLTEEVSKWVYQPLRVNGKPVSMTTELAIRFNLRP